ncbi:hypothetical protein CHS0354_012984 [Potamilus streckersoni]|uniref:ATP-dependent RNA helicase n=1 Tax=Potamilus streckersoni TaxID=2493646 RepID=A0AAE0T845_9BIVA|nr:hypothetical protein CHS0354_012984 [Potamilus streckersoni]
MKQTARGRRNNFKKGNTYSGNKGKAQKKQLYQSKKKAWQIVDEEIVSLKARYDQINSSEIKNFTDIPLSKKTLDGLKYAKYETPTDIQREAIGLAIQGNDILGAAKTGSGKTLAFLIPVLEHLYQLKWSQLDGLGALIISPTRELAYQIFEVLRKIGRFHDFSAGLVIGGKKLQEESERIHRTNIVICTPGRLLQHMDETACFTADSLKILVLDEADRILDLGFAQTMNAIIENLPSERQTLLFSATQTRSVKDLARLSLKNPMYVSVHENAQHSTPTNLEQSYVVCELHEKLSFLWSFIKNHLKSKVLVFLMSCKQVRYVHEAFCRLRPGIPVLALHGGMNQLKRVAVYNQFVWKQHSVLFATDIAARGLDFPAVNWVLQLDCPEDANTYIHRAGRTARYETDGEALLLLLPSEEEAMIEQLKAKKIPIDKIKVNSKKLQSIQPKLEANCAADPSLKEMAQRAFVSYLRSVFLMSNKAIFKVLDLNIEEFARSLGLAVAPKVRFLKREQKRIADKEANKNGTRDSERGSKLKRIHSDCEKEDEEEEENEEEVTDFETGSQSEHSESDSESESENVWVTQGLTGAKKCQNITTKLKQKENVKQLSDSTKRKGSFVQESDSDFSEDASDSDVDDSDTSDSGHFQEFRTSKITAGSNKLDARKDDVSIQKMGTGTFKFDVDEDEEELFTVKKRNVDIESETDDSQVEDQHKRDKQKALTKAAIAKKVQKKNLKVNKKVVFDEEGEAIHDRLKTPQASKNIVGDEEAVGGIDIEMARRRMKEEDWVDKQLFREKIKKKHKEERLKKKEERRAKMQQNRADEQEEDEGNEVVLEGEESEVNPLDFIPDPDEIYGPEKSGDELSEASENSMDDEENQEPYAKKRKISRHEKDNDEGMSEEENFDGKTAVSEVEEEDSDEDLNDIEEDLMEDTGLDLQTDEAIALRLLQGKR